MRIEWTRQADAMLLEAVDAMAAERPAAAHRWLDRMMERVRLLSRFPDLGRVVPECGRQEIREIIVEPYRVPYHRGESAVTILGVMHDRRMLLEQDFDDFGGTTAE